MNIGYACLVENVPNTKLKTCNLKNASENRLLELIKHNLEVLDRMIDYNVLNNIHLFRISSDIIPFGSNEVNQIEWTKLFSNELNKIGNKIKQNKIRVSMHPGQYTVLNSNKPEVVEKAILDLDYHNKFLDALKVDKTNKIILHIGGIYDDKDNSIKRFISNFNKLPESIKERLVIENDDKNYNIEDVYYISKIINIPIVFDVFHHEVNHIEKSGNYIDWIIKCSTTWTKEDGNPKIHYSEQDLDKKAGSHSKTIDTKRFIKFYKSIPLNNIDIMLEVKDKNISAIKCIKALEECKDV